MSATVTGKHRELAWQRIKDACSLLPPRVALVDPQCADAAIPFRGTQSNSNGA